MTEDPRPGETGSDEVQFDRAEYAEAESGGAGEGAVCAGCSIPIEGTYFEVGGTIHCQSCSDQIREVLQRPGGIARPAKALVFGLVAALVGSGLYFAILKLTGYELGLVAIVVGFMVGFAVRAGSGGRGGRGYQMLAVALTYCAIVFTYMPLIIEVAMQQAEAQESSATGEGSQPAPAGESPSSGESTENTEQMSFVAALASLCVLALQLPVLGIINDPGGNIIWLLIIGFALYQAFVMTRKVEVQITGPYELGAEGSSA